jgi:hypothetical protein
MLNDKLNFWALWILKRKTDLFLTYNGDIVFREFCEKSRRRRAMNPKYLLHQTKITANVSAYTISRSIYIHNLARSLSCRSRKYRQDRTLRSVYDRFLLN